jgi:DNA-binding transcriptional MerR regulator
VYDELVGASGIAIPDKVFFRIGEVADLTGVKAYVLRFWEKEFSTLHPKKSRSGQRRYRRSDIQQVLCIKTLLWDRKFTIQGARDELKRVRAAERAAEESPVVADEDPDRVATALAAAPVDTRTSPPLPAVRGPAEVEEARAELDALRDETAAFRLRVLDSEAALEAVRSARAGSDGELARLRSKLEESEADLGALRAAHDQLQERHAMVAGEQVRMSAEMARLQQESAGRSPSADQERLLAELLAVRSELLRFKARLGARLSSTLS